MVMRPIDTLTAKYQLLIDLRRFQISTADKPVADIEFTARILEEGGKVVAAKLFHVTVPTKVTDAATAAASLNEAFQKAATELVLWTTSTI
jgi:phospholipid/cholesterol/gamma-HCH transport system substrate-binding protein